ncbi:MAG TPA: sulfatase-like hydrolase/transferase [Solirubrobacteraceae bacterium]|nr:sulfatase-like hydrolase/transferase [Solirubrobacteraceae bacterium]
MGVEIDVRHAGQDYSGGNVERPCLPRAIPGSTSARRALFQQARRHRGFTLLGVQSVRRPGGAPGAAPERGLKRQRPLLWAMFHLSALWALAVAQPIFDLIRQNPDFLAARGMRGFDVVLFAVVIALAPPLLMVAVEAAAGLAAVTLRRWVHLVFVAVLVALIGIQALEEAGASGTAVLIVLAGVIGIAAALLYRRSATVRSFLTVLSPAPLLVLGLFLFVAPIADLVLASDPGAADVRIPGSVPVVMVVFDEVSTIALEDARQRIDSTMFPNLAALARSATWFRHATAPTDETTTATPALLSGSFPKRQGLPIASHYPRNLFTLLGASYRMIVSQEATGLCPQKLCREPTRGNLAQRQRTLASDTGLVFLHVIAPPALERTLPSVSETIAGFGEDDGRTRVTLPLEHTGKVSVLRALAGGRAARFEQLVRTIERSPLKTLYFKHSLLPHVPFQYLPSGRRYLTEPHEPIPGLSGAPSWGNEFLLAQAYQRHILQMAFADRLLGTLLERLKRTGLYDRALVVVTADNGESFLHHAHRHVATPENVHEIAATPLIIKAPGQRRGRIDDGSARTIDVLPTIADLLGARLPWPVEGRSIWSRPARPPQRVEFLERSGDRLVLAFSDFKRRVRTSLARKLQVFGSNGAAPDMFNIGPHPELAGRWRRPPAARCGRRSTARAPSSPSTCARGSCPRSSQDASRVPERPGAATSQSQSTAASRPPLRRSNWPRAASRTSRRSCPRRRSATEPIGCRFSGFAGPPRLPTSR